jgi:hypothetical protein
LIDGSLEDTFGAQVRGRFAEGEDVVVQATSEAMRPHPIGPKTRPHHPLIQPRKLADPPDPEPGKKIGEISSTKSRYGKIRQPGSGLARWHDQDRRNEVGR